MKKYISMIVFALVAMVESAVSQNVVSLSSGQGREGEVLTVDVTLSNSDPVSGLEILLPLIPKQLEYVDGSAILDAGRADGHLISAAVVDDTLRIYVYSLSLNNIKGNDGKLLSFDLKFGKQPAHFLLQPQVLLGDANGNTYPVELKPGVATMVAPKIEPVTSKLDYGHVPLFSTYTAALELRNSGTEPVEVTGLQFSTTQFSAAETSFTMGINEIKTVLIEYRPTQPGAVNGTVTIVSNSIDGNDVVELVADPYMVNELSLIGANGLSYEEVTVQLSLKNMDPITGVQVEFELPEALEYVTGTFATTERSAQLSASSTYENGVLTLLLYSYSNAVIESGEGIIATFRLRLAGEDGTYSLNPLNVTLGNGDAVDVTSATYGGEVVINAPVISGEDILVIQDAPITSKALGKYPVHNNGNAPLEIIDAAFLADGFRVASELPFVVEPFSCDTLYVEYTPVESGTYSTTMNLYTNDPKNRVKSVAVSGRIYAPNAFTFDGENLQNGDYVMRIGMDNYTDIVAMQMDIHIIEGMTTSDTLMQVTQRLANHSWTLTKVNATTYRFVAFSLTNSAIAGNEGKLFDLTFVPDEGVVYKDTPIVIDNVVLSGADGRNYSSQPSLNITAGYRNFYVRFVCDGEMLGESFQSKGTDIVYPQLPEKTGHSLSWKVEGGDEKRVASPIDLAGNADEMLYSNAPCISPGAEFQGWHVLFDNNLETIFHSEFDASKGSADGLHHYIRVDMGEGNGIDRFAFTYATSSTVYPTRMIVEGSNVADGVYDEIACLADLPTAEAVYCSDTLGNGNRYRYIRFRVVETQDNYPYGRPFFIIAELGMTEYALKFPVAPDKVPDEDIVINALYTPNSYTVTYRIDGEVLATDTVVYGEEIVLPDVPDMEGYTFSGWGEVPGTMPANDIVLEGSYVVNSYNIIYKVDGEVYCTVPVNYGAQVTLMDEPVKDRHIFSGWSMTEGYDEIDIASNADAMLYSNAYCTDTKYGDDFKGWHVLFDNDPSTFFHSEYNPNGSSSDGLEHYIRVDLGEGNAIESFSFTYTTRHDNTSGSPTRIVVEGSNVPNGVYDEIVVLTDLPTYNATYCSDTLGNGNRYRYIRFRVTETLYNQSPSGHPYFYISEFGMTEYSLPKTMPANDIVVEGRFIKNIFDVRYVIDDEEFCVLPVERGDTIPYIEVPAREGHTFSGWSCDYSVMPEEDIVVTGSYTVNSYVLTYLVDGEVYATETVVYGSGIVLLDEPVREGHTFSGWSEAPATMPAEDVVIEGTFAVDYYTITYLVDGEVYATETVAYGSGIVLLDEPVREGHTFSGWSEAPATMPAEDVVIEGCFTPVTWINGVEYDAKELIIYNLSGVRIIDRDELERGFYIINGKKVLIK